MGLIRCRKSDREIVMKYELSFLNNIHDSMEMVNVELDPFLDLFSQGYFDELTIKHIRLLKIYLKKLKKIFEIQ